MLALVGIAASGCRLDVTAAGQLDRDGSGTASVSLRMDDALLDELDRLAIDPTIEVTAAAAATDGWTLERTVDEQQAITIELVSQVDDPAGIGAAFRELSRGLTDDDPGLHIDIEVTTASDGSATVDGSVGFRSPATAGVVVDGDPLGPSAGELAARTAEVVVPRLQLTLPGPVVSHDADRVEGRTVGWDIPIDGSRTIVAVSEDPALHQEPWFQLALAALLVVLGTAALVVRRRTGRVRRRRRRGRSAVSRGG